ncbi:MAG: cysteine desulfurase [Lachnospiraceae bacterium]|nr:cysteine desulfurase [Lachnospiraceae bacterium]
MKVYLDNSATTKVLDSVRDIMVKTMQEDYGNPSSMHLVGMYAENYVKEAKNIIASALKVDTKEIYFTSGGTESNNMTIIGSAMANKRAGMHIITSAIEHPSVSNTMKYLEEQGFEVTRIGVDSEGIINLDELQNALREDTILVSVMYVNNEIGSVQPISEISKIIKNYNHSILFHVDAIQAFGKLEIYPRRFGVDMMSVSGHKIHGPKGSGFVYIKDKTKIKPIIHGGGQQNAMRSGTENVPGIAGIGQAVADVYSNLRENSDKMMKMKNYFIDEITKLEGVSVNSGKDEKFAPHIISVSVDGVRSEVLLHALEEKGIYISAGSACSSNKPAVSETLKAIGLPKNLLDSTVRFSLSSFTTKEELDYAIEAMKEMLAKLRIYIRK